MRQPTASFAKSLNIKVWKECSAKEKKIKEAIEAILLTAMEPQRGLSDESLEKLKKLHGESELLSYPVKIFALLLIVGAGLGAAILYNKGFFALEKAVVKK